MSFLSKLVDERFLDHRRRSTSFAGTFTAAGSLVLFLYRHYAEHVWSWDLFAVGCTFVVLKLAFMAWYFLKD